MRSAFQKFGAILVMSSCLLVAAAQAGEGITNPTPVGGTDLNQALLPPTGLYGGVAALPPVNGGPHYNNEFGQNNPFAEDIHIHVFAAAAGALYVYPWEVFGGRIGTSIQIPFYTLELAPNAVHGFATNRSGLSDIYSDAFYWSKNVGLFGATPGSSEHIVYGLTVAGGFAFKAPTGVYVATNSFSTGSNLWLMTPNVALTYNTGPNWSLGDSTQVSARLFATFPLQNSATGYRSGDVLDVDWSVSQKFGDWQAGVAGFVTYQYTADVGTNKVSGLACPSAACIDGNRFGEFGLGPVVEYHVPGTPVSIKAKFTHDLWAKNNLFNNVALLAVSMKLY